MTKTKKGLFFTAGILLATVLTFSCSGGGLDSLLGGTAPAIATPSLPSGAEGAAYSQVVTATGDAPITWSLESGALPNGLNLMGNGIISGTPTTAGTFSFIVKATNATGSDMKALSITIATAGDNPNPNPDPGGSSSSVVVSSSSVGVGDSSSSLGGDSSSSVVIPDAFASKEWTQVSPSPFDNARVYDVAFGNGVWVAVGYGGRIAYSSDARSWTLVPRGTGAGQSGISTVTDIRAVAFGNGRFVAGGGSSMASSTDGRTWTAVQSGLSGMLDIAFGGNRWVAGGSRGSMATSTDGTNWTAVADSTFGTGSIHGIAFGGNRWVAVGEYGRMATSTNGTSWTAVDASSAFGSSGISKIAFGGNRWVAVTGGRIAASTNGTSWPSAITGANTHGFYGTTSENINDVAFGNNRFVVVGIRGKAATSTDGSTWTPIANTLTGFDTSEIHGINADGNGMFVAVGNDGKIAWVSEE